MSFEQKLNDKLQKDPELSFWFSIKCFRSGIDLESLIPPTEFDTDELRCDRADLQAIYDVVVSGQSTENTARALSKASKKFLERSTDGAEKHTALMQEVTGFAGMSVADGLTAICEAKQSLLNCSMLYGIVEISFAGALYSRLEDLGRVLAQKKDTYTIGATTVSTLLNALDSCNGDAEIEIPDDVTDSDEAIQFTLSVLSEMRKKLFELMRF